MEVRTLGESDRDTAFATLVTAFAADPVSRWVMRAPRDFLALFPVVLAHMAGGAFGAGGAFATACGRGVALWLPPGAGADLEAVGTAFAEAGIDGPADAPAFFGMMAERHPVEPHWYLPFIGVDPAAQGGGLGTALLDAVLARVDALGLPAYLESSNPRNIPLYERAGFRATGIIQVGDSPIMTPMWRPAR